MKLDFDKEIDYLFFFCKSCWKYTKFLSDGNIDWTKTNAVFVCVECKNEQAFADLKELEEYYDHLNDHND
ncbi:hypothetical protein [Mesoplasma photuris]|uniref:hypothetical protein n=1 Tax=Mesoplasma photuris TaxID=217731 RepID=UPI0004E1CA54|nr:hypothetical protein [Mesoplasma photuris]